MNHEVRCGAKMPAWRDAKLPRWKLQRAPQCNKPSGHDGPHREYGVGSAEIKAEWTEAAY